MAAFIALNPTNIATFYIFFRRTFFANNHDKCDERLSKNYSGTYDSLVEYLMFLWFRHPSCFLCQKDLYDLYTYLYVYSICLIFSLLNLFYKVFSQLVPSYTTMNVLHPPTVSSPHIAAPFTTWALRCISMLALAFKSFSMSEILLRCYTESADPAAAFFFFFCLGPTRA